MAIYGHSLSAEEQVKIAVKSEFGLKLLSNFFEYPKMGCSFSEYLMAYIGLSPCAMISISKPVFAKVLATTGNSAVASVPPE